MNGSLCCLPREPVASRFPLFQVEDQLWESGAGSRAVPMPAPTLQPAQLPGDLSPQLAVALTENSRCPAL